MVLLSPGSGRNDLQEDLFGIIAKHLQVVMIVFVFSRIDFVSHPIDKFIPMVSAQGLHHLRAECLVKPKMRSSWTQPGV